MEYLINLLKHSSLFELVLIAAAIIVGLILIPIGIWIVIRAKSRLTVLVFVLSTFLPLLFSLVTIGARWMHEQQLEKMNEAVSGDPIVEKFRREAQADYLTTGAIGGISTTLPFLIGLSGFVIKRRS